MTIRYDTGFSPKYLDSNQLVQSATVPTLRGTSARMSDRRKMHQYAGIESTSANFTFHIAAEDAGFVKGIVLNNGSVPADGTNGLKVVITNTSNSNDVVASFGFGSNTNAAAAVDKLSALAANTAGEILCTDTSHVNKGDVLLVTGTRDGSTIVGVIDILMSYTGVGR